jgi:transcriptional regulator with XRE-family HTH domain
MEFANRLNNILGTLSINQSALALKMGVSKGIISEFSSGAREPSKDFLFGLSKIGISLDWFLTGEGEMFRNQESDTPEPEKPAKTVFEIPLLTKEQLLSFEPEKEIPEKERKANSGDYPDLTYIPVPMRVMEYSTDLRAVVAFDSRMAPVIRSGDIAIFEATGWGGNGIYLYRMGGKLHIGYVGHYDNTHHLFNERSKDDELPYDETFKAIGRVRAVVSDLSGNDWKGGKQPPD